MTDSDDLTEHLAYYDVAFNPSDRGWYLQDYFGSNNWFIKQTHGLAMNPNDAAVPIPGAVWLIGSGLGVLIGISKKSKKSSLRGEN